MKSGLIALLLVLSSLVRAEAVFAPDVVIVKAHHYPVPFFAGPERDAPRLGELQKGDLPIADVNIPGHGTLRGTPALRSTQQDGMLQVRIVRERREQAVWIPLALVKIEPRKKDDRVCLPTQRGQALTDQTTGTIGYGGCP